MRSAVISTLAAVAMAAPVVERAAGPTDVQILNYALTLEHLEATFYQEALAKFTASDFTAAGVAPAFYNNLQEIASDEQTHVHFLTSAVKGMSRLSIARHQNVTLLISILSRRRNSRRCVLIQLR